MPTYSMGQTARLLRVSPETVRRWADAGQLPMVRDGPGNRMSDGAGLARFDGERALDEDDSSRDTQLPGHTVPGTRSSRDTQPTSVPNALPGIITAVRSDGVLAQVEIQAGPHRVVSAVTSDAIEEMGLAVGITVTARVKSTNVHVDRP